MTSDRRNFIRKVSAGMAGVGFVRAKSYAMQTINPTNASDSKVKMVVRADDIGFSKVCNIGSFKAIEEGIVTSADIMLDSPGTEDALERLKKLPWISIGWHTHMWGSPVLDAKNVPSLIEKEGEFKGRFRLDLSTAQDVDFNEAVRELRAQLDKCLRILGRVPDTGTGGNDNSPWGKAMKQVSEEFGLVCNFFSYNTELDAKPIIEAKSKGAKWAQAYTPTNNSGFSSIKTNGEWDDKKIYFVGAYAANTPLNTDSFTVLEEEYDPVLFFTEDRAGILNFPQDSVVTTVWHPGYVDYWVYRLGERGNRAQARKYVLSRAQDVAGLCDDKVKSWVKQNRIELVNFRDALYGTSDYQNYLKMMGSDLAIM